MLLIRGLRVLALLTLISCGAPRDGIAAYDSAVTMQSYTSGGLTWSFYRPDAWPNGTNCPIRYYYSAGSPIYLQDWCPTGTFHVEMCSWFHGDTHGYVGSNNSWCAALDPGTRIADLAFGGWQDPDRGWNWQLSFLQMDRDYLGNGVQQIALCTDANFSGICRFFGNAGDAGLTGYLQYDIRRFTQDASGRPYPHMSLAVQ